MSEEQQKIIKMLEQARNACDNSYCVYSDFPVGACVRSNNGKFYNGCNVENGSYSLAICAEASAVASMINGGCKSIKDVFVYSKLASQCSPCGACRQIIHEFSSDTTNIYLCDNDGSNIQKYSIASLLPNPFVL
ncbi:MAG: cytidine deaminase [Legionellales bacterium]|nr:cytidine deaminase [Legionellales bacterium]